MINTIFGTTYSRVIYRVYIFGRGKKYDDVYIRSLIFVSGFYRKGLSSDRRSIFLFGVLGTRRTSGPEETSTVVTVGVTPMDRQRV